MKPYRFIGVTLVSVDKHGATRTDVDWQIDITPGKLTTFKLKGCADHGIQQIFDFIVKQLVRFL